MRDKVGNKVTSHLNITPMKDVVSGGGNDPLDGNGGSFILGFIDMDDKTFEVHNFIYIYVYIQEYMIINTNAIYIITLKFIIMKAGLF